jgi:Transposase IS116/IS110/IS902 family
MRKPKPKRPARARGRPDTQSHRAPGGPPTLEGLDELIVTPEPPAEESLFRLTYRLVEDLQRVRLSHANRTRQVIPLIPAVVQPPRGVPSWGEYFSGTALALATEEARLLALARRLLETDPLGQWLLSQKGVGPALALSILGETWPLTRFKNPGKLWAFAGVDVSEGVGVNKNHPRLREGEKVYRWNWRLKTRLYLFGVSVLRAGDGPWRTLYDERKAFELMKLGVTGGAQVFNGAREEDAPAGALQAVDAHASDAPGGAQHASDTQVKLPPAGAHAEHGAHDTLAPGGAPTPDALLGAQRLSAPAGPDLEADRAQQTHDDPQSIQPVGLRGHAHQRALRYIAKAFLLDLWRVAHGQEPLVVANQSRFRDLGRREEDER